MKFAIVICLIGLIVAVSADCNENGKTYKVGEYWQPAGRCYKVVCKENNIPTISVCDKLVTLKDFREYEVIEPKGFLPFPDCCPHWQKREKKIEDN